MYGTGECAPAEKPAEPVREFTDAPQLCIDTATTYTATFETNKGTIVVELNDDEVPGTVNNFVTLAGGATTTARRSSAPTRASTSSRAAARTTPRVRATRSPTRPTASRTARVTVDGPHDRAEQCRRPQWFFVGGPKASALDAQGTYVTFGRVTEGLDVVKAILALAAATVRPPTEDVTISTVEITES